MGGVEALVSAPDHRQGISMPSPTIDNRLPHRHLADDEHACPYCEDVDARRRGRRDQVEALAHLTGLTVRRVRELLDGATLTLEDVAAAIWSGCVEPRAAHYLTGGQLVDLVVRQHTCLPGGGRGPSTCPDGRELGRGSHAT